MQCKRIIVLDTTLPVASSNCAFQGHTTRPDVVSRLRGVYTMVGMVRDAPWRKLGGCNDNDAFARVFSDNHGHYLSWWPTHTIIVQTKRHFLV